MYSEIATVDKIESLGWNYVEEPNTIGDWGISNQWLEKNDYTNYDVFLFTHDDNFIFGDNLFTDAMMSFDWDDWLVITNSPDLRPENQFWVRGSFEFFKKEMLDSMGGKFDLSDVKLTREGEVDSPLDTSSKADWNNTINKFAEHIKENQLQSKLKKLSDTIIFYSRISQKKFHLRKI